jgi:LysR family transcriptional regulator, regulator for metE and metH
MSWASLSMDPPVGPEDRSPAAVIGKAHCFHTNDAVRSSTALEGALLEIRHLQLVRAIAEEGGVTRASRRLHLSQSALSHQLKDAEVRLDARLFDRIGKRMVLTAAGERLLRSARSVIDEMERAEQEIRRQASRAGGRLRLTTQCNTVYHWLPSRLRLFHRAYPEVDLEVVAGATDDPLPALLEGAIDLAIVYRTRRDARLAYRPLFRDEIVVVMRPGHPLCRRPYVDAPDFAPEHLIVYSVPRESNLVFREVLIPAGIAPSRVTHVQLTEGIVELVKEGLGISVLARWSVAPQVERGELVARPLTAAGRYRQWSAAWRAKPAPPPHLVGFVDVLARNPLPLGRTPRERRRIASAVVAPAARKYGGV